MTPNGKQLSHIVELIDSGKIKNIIHKVWPLEEARYAPFPSPHLRRYHQSYTPSSSRLLGVKFQVWHIAMLEEAHLAYELSH